MHLVQEVGYNGEIEVGIEGFDKSAESYIFVSETFSSTTTYCSIGHKNMENM